MNRRAPYIILIIISLVIACNTVLGQVNNPSANKEAQEIKVNDLDIIYEEEGYDNIIINQEPPSQRPPQAPPMLAAPVEDPEEDEDEDDEELEVLLPTDDEGAESEGEILYESFDSDKIHYTKKAAELINDTIQLSSAHFAFPTPYTARATSHYGRRRRRFHYGVDLALPVGEPIYAAFDGVVRVSKMNRTYGNLIVIRHYNGLETYYAHMSKRKAMPGDKVKAGDVIGLCGNTGRSYGSHLHFEIRYLGNAMDPENVIDCSTHKLIDETLHLTSESFKKTNNRSSYRNGDKSSSHRASQGKKKYYKVRAGDTLEKIARRNGTTVKKLCKLNGIKKSSKIQKGRRLRIR